LRLFIITAALAVILILCGIAIFYLVKLGKQKKKQSEALLEIEKQANEKYQKIRQDIVFIANSFLNDQVELPEASLRISRLADLVIDKRESRDLYSVFDKIARELSNIPTHQDWKDLTKQERKKHNAKMQDLTQLNTDAAKLAARKIVSENKVVH